MNTEDKLLSGFGAVVVVGLIAYLVLSINATLGFCEREFADVPRWECVLSSRYRYDHD